MEAPPRWHVWMFHGSSLCGLRQESNARPLKEGEDLRPCGPCIIAGHVLLSSASGMARHPESGHPVESPEQAADELARGPFGDMFHATAIREYASRYPTDWTIYVTPNDKGEEK